MNIMKGKLFTKTSIALAVAAFGGTEASAQHENVDLYNFAAGGYESVTPDQLTPEAARSYLPQYENAVAIFDHFISTGHSAAEALNLTYDAIIDAVSQIDQEAQAGQ